MRILPKLPIQRGTYFTHRKGGTYRVVATALIEATLTPCTVYQDMTSGRVWVRPFDEFNDGRFFNIDWPPSVQEQRSQAERCGCRGTNEMCNCQNSPDRVTLAERATASKGGAA